MRYEIVEFAFADETPDPDFALLMYNSVEWAMEFLRYAGGVDGLADREYVFRRVISDENWPGVAEPTIAQKMANPTGGAPYQAMLNAQSQTNEVLRNADNIRNHDDVRITVPTHRSHPRLAISPRAFASPLFSGWYTPSKGGAIVINASIYWTNLRAALINDWTFTTLKPLLVWSHLLAHELGHAAGVGHLNHASAPPEFSGIDCGSDQFLMCPQGGGKQDWADGSRVHFASATLMSQATWLRDSSTGEQFGDPTHPDYGTTLLPTVPASAQTIDEYTRGGIMPAVLTVDAEPFAAFDARVISPGDSITVDFEPIGPGEQAVILHDGVMVGGAPITNNAQQKVITPTMPGGHEIKAMVIRQTGVEPDQIVTYSVNDVPPPPPPVGSGEPTLDGAPWSAWTVSPALVGSVVLDFPGLPPHSRVSFRAQNRNEAIPPVDLGVITPEEPGAIGWNTAADEVADGPTRVRATRVNTPPGEPVIVESYMLDVTVDNTGGEEPPPPPPLPDEELWDRAQAHTRFGAIKMIAELGEADTAPDA